MSRDGMGLLGLVCAIASIVIVAVTIWMEVAG